MKTSKQLLSVLCLVLPIAAFAQSSWETPASPVTPRIDQRQSNQETRIQNAVGSGQLNTMETNRLERGQQRVSNMATRAGADGVVSAQERSRIRHAERRQSRRIYLQSHDGQPPR